MGATDTRGLEVAGCLEKSKHIDRGRGIWLRAYTGRREAIGTGERAGYEASRCPGITQTGQDWPEMFWGTPESRHPCYVYDIQ